MPVMSVVKFELKDQYVSTEHLLLALLGRLPT